MSEKRVCLGKIVGVNGIRGEVKVKSYTAVDKDIAAYGELEDKAAGKRFSLKVTGHSKDLVGMKVLDAKKAEVAEVVGFYNFGAGDILEIRLKSGRSEMLPFNKGYVPEINLDEGYIIVASTGMVFLEDGEDSEEC